MRTRTRIARLTFQIVLPLVIIAAVGWHFYGILRRPELRNAATCRIEWLIPACAIVLGLPHDLGKLLGHVVTATGVPHDLSNWLAGLLYQPIRQVHTGQSLGDPDSDCDACASRKDKTIVGVTATYETLTSMAAGAMLGAILLPLLKVDVQQVEGFGASIPS